MFFETLYYFIFYCVDATLYYILFVIFAAMWDNNAWYLLSPTIVSNKQKVSLSNNNTFDMKLFDLTMHIFLDKAKFMWDNNAGYLLSPTIASNKQNVSLSNNDTFDMKLFDLTMHIFLGKAKFMPN